MLVFTSVNPLSNAGSCELTTKEAQGTGENLNLLNRFEYCVRSYGLWMLTSAYVSSSSHVTVRSSRRVSSRFRTPTRNTVQLSIESIETNCGKSIGLSWVDGW